MKTLPPPKQCNSVDEVLGAAKNESAQLKFCVFVGEYIDGGNIVLSNGLTYASANWLLDKAKRRLMDDSEK